MYNYHWNASDTTRDNLDSHALWQFMFTTADRDAVVCHSSGGLSQIWKIMEMYLCRRCFISVWALWKIKISLCLWEERGWRGEGQRACGDEMRMHKFVFFSPFFSECVCFWSVCVFVHERDRDRDIILSFKKKKLPGKMWQKVQIMSWRQPLQTCCCEVRNISPPHLCLLHAGALPHLLPLLLHQHYAAGFCERAAMHENLWRLVSDQGTNKQTKKWSNFVAEKSSRSILPLIATYCETDPPFWADLTVKTELAMIISNCTNVQFH